MGSAGTEGSGALSITIDQRGVRVVVAPQGELDISNQQELRDAIADARTRDPAELVLDLRGLSFMDSSGLRVLIDTWNESKTADARLVMVVPKAGLVRRVLEVSGCDVILPIVDDLDETS
ncbi:MAG: STAS domain-containing protein [Actinomycetota bacterium]